jgi:hypothetical protein
MVFPPVIIDCRSSSSGAAGHRLYLRKVLADLTLCYLNIVVVLQVKPKRRRGSECPGEPERGIRGYTGFLIRKPLDARSGYPAGFRKRASRHFERDQEFFPENFTRVHGRELLCRFPGHLLFLIVRSHFHSMIVSDLDVFGPFARPDEAYTELIVDPDRVLAGPVGFQ